MKLINPTDDELNAVFAEEVAGWTDIRYEEGEDVDIDAREIYPWGGIAGSPPDGSKRRLVTPFTRSADAVLPWLNRHVVMIEHMCSQWRVLIHMGYTGGDKGPFTNRHDFISEGEGEFAYHAVIALLRAHDVEVEFT
jgi:hypothetical protein